MRSICCIEAGVVGEVSQSWAMSGAESNEAARHQKTSAPCMRVWCCCAMRAWRWCRSGKRLCTPISTAVSCWQYLPVCLYSCGCL